MNNLDKKVLEIVSVQGDYLIHPTASAFILEELEAGEVEKSLIRLCKKELIDYVQTTEVEEDEEGNEIEVVDESNTPIIIASGYKINKKGQLQLKELSGNKRRAKIRRRKT